MKIEMKVVINGKPCTQVFSKGQFKVFSVDSEMSDEDTIYFVNNDTVLFEQVITADCGQNVGFISGITYKGFN
jgi:hypothetical protein